MNHTRSGLLFRKAKQVMPGGVNSPVRAFKSVDLDPPFIKSAKGSRITDVDGNEYIDYVGSWGPMILGHANDAVTEEIIKAVKDGASFGAPTEREIELAELICEALPSIEMIRMTSSGTEAVMSAIRLARGYTGREDILKFEGCYHGHSDGLLIKAGSGALTMSIPDSAGIPRAYAKHTFTASFNDSDQLKKIFETRGDKLAAVIVEPVAGNMGVVKPDARFLRTLRNLTGHHGVVLIFDEVITGFRVGYNGAQGYYGINPDITVLGKIIGGGMPAGAYGGRKDIMGMVSPCGPVYQAGTLSGNPAAMAAGIKTIGILKDSPSIYTELEEKGARLEEAFLISSDKYGIPLVVNRVGSLMSAFFTGGKVIDYNSAVKSDTLKFKKYFKNMLQHNIYIAPSQYEAMFISHAHSKDDIERTAGCIDAAFAEISTASES